MAKKRMKLSDQVRREIEQCGMTRYRLSKITGIGEAALCKFMAGDGGLSIERLDILADTLLLNVTSDAPTQPQAQKRKAR